MHGACPSLWPLGEEKKQSSSPVTKMLRCLVSSGYYFTFLQQFIFMCCVRLLWSTVCFFLKCERHNLQREKIIVCKLEQILLFVPSKNFFTIRNVKEWLIPHRFQERFDFFLNQYSLYNVAAVFTILLIFFFFFQLYHSCHWYSFTKRWVF